MSAIIEIQGHRGCRSILPENSMAGIKECQKRGFDFVEIDVVCAGDGTILVAHDPHFNSTYTDASHQSLPNNFMKLTTPEIQAVNVGLKDAQFPKRQTNQAFVPTLEQVVDYLSQQQHPIGLNIEVKYDPEKPEYYPPVEVYCARIMKIVLGARSKIHMRIQSFSTDILKEIKGIYRWPYLGLLLENYVNINVVIGELGFTPSRWGVQHDMITEDLVDQVHSAGMKIDAWTVNHKEQAQRLADMYVDSIITDYPIEMQDWLEL